MFGTFLLSLGTFLLSLEQFRKVTQSQVDANRLDLIFHCELSGSDCSSQFSHTFTTEGVCSVFNDATFESVYKDNIYSRQFSKHFKYIYK